MEAAVLHLRRRGSWAGLALLLAVGGALVIYLGRTTNFYYDEWDWVLGRRAWNADALLAPHNEHLSVLPVLLYKLLFAAAGIGSYVPFRVAGMLAHLLVCALLFRYARPRVGDLAALGAVAVVLFLGPGWPGPLWPFQVGFLGSLAAGIGALIALDRGDRLGEIVASVLLAVALACSSIGLPIFAAAAFEILGRPDRRQRWFVLAGPLALYGAWYVAYGVKGDFTIDNFLLTPAYVAEAAAAAVGAMFGLTSEWGRPLTVAVAALLFLAARRGAADPWRLAALIALPLLFWTLTGLARADMNEPGAPRYLYPGVVFLLLIALEAARGVVLSRSGAAALVVLVGFVTVSNVGTLRNAGGYLRDQTAELDGALAAVQLPGPQRVGPGFQPEPTIAPQIHAGAYFDAASDLGSPAPAPAELPRLYGRGRAAADSTLVRAYEVGLGAPPGGAAGAAPAPENAVAAATRAQGSCLRARPQAPSSVLELAVPPRGLLLASDGGAAKVFVRRFSEGFPKAPVGDLVAGANPLALRIPPDASTAPWHVRLTLSGAVRVCRLGR
jgi:hypothetical protein